ncbi:MAG: hydantoinase/oxoprolinase family protein [Hyphomicrobiaceae bacterium]
MPSHTTPLVRVASDVGGTFTDSIAYDEASGTITVSKVSTTPQNRALGTVEGLRRALEHQGRTGADVDYVGHGMTTTTNAVIQRKGARTAFVTNDGFKDLLLIGRQDRPSLFDIAQVRTPPLVPRELCLTVRGRLDARGAEVTPLDEAALVPLAEAIRAAGVEAVAVMFLHAYANPTHEMRAKAVLAPLLPGIVVCTSTEILAEFREYERASTTVLNAYLMPVMDRYLGSLIELLEAPKGGLGVRRGKPIMVMEAAGGLMTVASARARPVHTVLSGPAGGVVASGHVAAMAGVTDIITMDIGGTSTDISLIRNGRPEITRSAKLERIPIRVPVIDINAIGAGGGSIAWIDDGGALRVGPQSAEAVPGPACYGRGGEQPTVTDAALVLGRLGGATRLGGELTLDLEAARRVVSRVVASPLGLTLEEAAAGILRVANSNIVRGIRVVSVERGYDPRVFTLVPFGGAGPMHGTPVARELGITRILVPPTPGILCALGMLVSDLRHDLMETHIGPLRAFTYETASAIVERLAASGRAMLDEDLVPAAKQSVEIHVQLRYAGQSYELTVPLDVGDPKSWDGLAGRFHEAHRRRYGHADEAAPVEVVGFGVTAIGLIDTPRLPTLADGGAEPPADALVGERPVYYESDAGGTWHAARIYQREKLLAGNRISGPAIIDEISATTVLYPGDRVTVHSSGNLIQEVM